LKIINFHRICALALAKKFSIFAAMSEPELTGLIPALIFAYTEMHYRFRFSFNLYKKREPEIVMDAPRRLDPGQNLPVSLIIKDSHLYPISLEALHVFEPRDRGRFWEFPLQQDLKQPIFHQIFEIKAEELQRRQGENILLEAVLHYRIRGKKRYVFTHNLRQLRHDPLQIYIASQKLPGHESYLFGDIHVHSDATDDQVEFGAPVECLAATAKAFGLQFQPITDHSYDLDDEPGHYNLPNPNLPRWKKLTSEIEKFSSEAMLLIRGEEVSAGNHRGENVHFLVINHSEYIPGSGDSAERWFRFKPELSIPQILEMADSKALLIAAHPAEPTPFLQKLLLNRGAWRFQQPDRLNGFQILNGKLDIGFREGLRQWIKQLLLGKKQFIYGGSDAHGNFNRYRQIKIPMLTLLEKDEHTLGSGLTAVMAKANPESILEAMQKGRCYITTGFGLWLTLENEAGQIFHFGERAVGDRLTIRARALSNSEFSAIERCRLSMGLIGEAEEQALISQKVEKDEWQAELSFSPKGFGYIRLEAWSVSQAALSNPIWFGQEPRR
jgi:hypothetical protein